MSRGIRRKVLFLPKLIDKGARFSNVPVGADQPFGQPFRVPDYGRLDSDPAILPGGPVNPKFRIECCVAENRLRDLLLRPRPIVVVQRRNPPLMCSPDLAAL